MKVILQSVRLSFPRLWTPKEYEPGDGKPRFDASFLIVPGSDNDKRIRAAIAHEAEKTLGKRAPSMLASWAGNSNKNAYLDGNTKDYDGYAGRMCLAAHAKTRPTVIDRDKAPLVEVDGRPYAGCFVNAQVDVYVQDAPNAGLRASFAVIQFAGDGEAFGAGAPPDMDAFDDLTEGADAAADLV